MSEHKIIKNIKIFGERNSGTKFLTSLIKKNIKDINIFSSYYKGGTGWKHGFPRIKLFNELIKDWAKKVGNQLIKIPERSFIKYAWL